MQIGIYTISRVMQNTRVLSDSYEDRQTDATETSTQVVRELVSLACTVYSSVYIFS
jgi:hypothetical protein